MKKLLFLLMLLPSVAFATLTPGNVPVTKTGGTSPTLQNSDITDTGGSVGIGIASPSLATGFGLDVYGNNPALRLQSTATNGQAWEWQSTVISSVSALNLSNITAGNNPFTILSTGNVGIGAISPTSKVQLGGTCATIGPVGTCWTSTGQLGYCSGAGNICTSCTAC